MHPEKWQLEEAIMLVDLYFRIESMPSSQTQREIDRLSALLRKRAEILRKPVDERYRNIDGVKMRLKSIQYLTSNGTAGLDSPSKASALAIQLRQQLPDFFAQSVNEFYERYQTVI